WPHQLHRVCRCSVHRRICHYEHGHGDYRRRRGHSTVGRVGWRGPVSDQYPRARFGGRWGSGRGGDGWRPLLAVRGAPEGRGEREVERAVGRWVPAHTIPGRGTGQGVVADWRTLAGHDGTGF